MPNRGEWVVGAGMRSDGEWNIPEIPESETHKVRIEKVDSWHGYCNVYWQTWKGKDL